MLLKTKSVTLKMSERIVRLIKIKLVTLRRTVSLIKSVKIKKLLRLWEILLKRLKQLSVSMLKMLKMCKKDLSVFNDTTFFSASSDSYSEF